MRILILGIALLLLIAAIMPARADIDAKNLNSRANYFDTSDSDFVAKFLKPGTYMRPSEVKPGMEGYGLSVFRGTKIERFNVRIIGVMKRVNNGRDAILARISGPAMGKNNVIRGMSGSPVYIDDKLIGAVSYGFDFSTEPIAGITPIVDMLDAMAKSNDPAKIGMRIPLEKRKLMLAPSVVSGPSSELGKFGKTLMSASSPHMVPLMCPVSLSGFSERAQTFLRSRFETLGIPVSSGTGGALDSNLSAEETKEANALRPGSALGVMLTTGDFESASTGTVTANFNGRIVGFGHPFVQAGMVDFPMASGFIHDVLPSLSISFKLSSPVAVLGTIYSDRPWSIGGEVGGRAKMVPVSVEVVDGERHIRKQFSSQVVDHEDLTPELVAACAMSAMDATYQSSAPYVARVETNVEVENQPAIKRLDCLTNSYGSGGMSSALFRPFFSDPVSGNIHSITSRILSNRYKKTRLKSVSLKIQLESGRNLTRIVRVSTDRPVVKPGEKVTLTCLLEPYNGEPYTESIDVSIPRDTPDGDIVLGISGGSQLEDLRKRMNLVDPPTTSLEQIIRRIQERPRGDRLFAVLALPNQSIHVDGEVLDSPPGYWNKLFFSNRYTHGPSLANGERKISKEIPSLVEGTHIVAVTVKRRDAFMETAPWYIATPGGSGKAAMGAYVTTQAQKAIDSLNKTDVKAKPADAATPAVASADNSAAKSGLSLFSQSSDDTHIRPVQVWNQTEDSAFKGGTKDGVIIDSWGRMFPGFRDSKTVSMPGALRAWSAVWSKGSVYIGSSNRIYRWSPDLAQPEEVAKFNDCVAIPAMAADSKGRVFASLAPSGRVVAIDGGKSSDLAKLSESIVTCLTVDDDDTLYAGVAGTGKVYRITSGGASALVDTGDAHVLSMFFDRNSKRLYLGCGEQGNAYSVSKGGQLRAEFHCNDHLITGVCRTKRGDLYITTAGSGHLIRITPTGETYELATSEAFYTLFYHAETDSVFAGDAEGDVTQISEEPLTWQSFFVPVKHTEQEAVIALCSDGANHLYAVTSNLPSIIAFSVKPESAEFTSPVKDGERPAHWSLIRVYGSFNETRLDLEKLIMVETRTGATVRPDSTWSPWAPAQFSNEGNIIQSPDNRYFQYRLKWLTTAAKGDSQTVFPQGRDLVIGRVAVTYLPSNSRPRFSTVSLRAGTYCNENEEVSIVGTDPDGDSLSLAVSVSDDGGKTFKPLQSDLRPPKKNAKTETKDEKKTSDKKKEKTDSKPAEGKTDTTDKDKDKTRSSTDKSSGDEAMDADKPAGDAGDKPAEDGSSDTPKEKPPDDGEANPREDTSVVNSRVKLQDSDEERDKNKPKDKDKPEEKKPDDKDKPQQKPEDKNKPAKPEEKSDAAKKNGEKKTADKAAAKTPTVKKKPAEGDQTEKFTWYLTPANFKNGDHIIRFTLSDAPSNMVQSEELHCYRYVVIDTVKPKIGDAKVSVASNQLHIELDASDVTSPIANATLQIDSEEPRAFAVVGGLADKREVHLLATGVPLKKGAHKVEIEVVDKAGNKATKSIKLPTH